VMPNVHRSTTSTHKACRQSWSAELHNEALEVSESITTPAVLRASPGQVW
jgi:hypothetical protein